MKVAVLGYGTVGKGVYDMLADIPGMERGPVLVRPGKADAGWKVTSIETITADPTVDAVVEVMGGEDPAYQYVEAALRAGKHVVTANKALVAARGIDLAATARESGAAFLFSAACGGGVPFLHNLSLAAVSDRIRGVAGILNGTTNYMLDAMQRKNLDYAAALKAAQELGYAEADPTADVSGLDALRKLVLACAVAFGKLPKAGLCCEGITSLTAGDVEDFRSLGYTCRLMAKGAETADGLYAFVEPTLLAAGSAEGTIIDNYNLARYEADRAGHIVLTGQGAGRYPTASAVLRDLSSLRLGQREMLPAACGETQADNTLCTHAYYVRVSPKAASAFRWSSQVCHKGWVRLRTVPMSVQEMHALAGRLRQDGESIFFAGIEE